MEENYQSPRTIEGRRMNGQVLSIRRAPETLRGLMRIQHGTLRTCSSVPENHRGPTNKSLSTCSLGPRNPSRTETSARSTLADINEKMNARTKKYRQKGHRHCRHRCRGHRRRRHRRHHQNRKKITRATMLRQGPRQNTNWRSTNERCGR